MHLTDRQGIEISLLLEALRRRHGYDFGGYAEASLRRRILSLQDVLKEPSISRLTERLIHDEAFVHRVIAQLSVPVSEMFRDPAVFSALRREVLPRLSSFPHLNVWQAGCAHGEEVYSLAILLQEAGLWDRTQIYATDISDAALERAREGIYPASQLELFSRNYRESGGEGNFLDYCTVRYNLLKIRADLHQQITFANHNLAADGVFGEMHLILCRNVLIYFTEPLQQRVLELFASAIVRGGFLCLGSKEVLPRTGRLAEFVPAAAGLPIYRHVQSGR
jgi:chemotaxis protein methyltransferase CheR